MHTKHLLLALVAKVEQEHAAACLVGVHFGLPVFNKGAAHAVSAKGGGFRQACLSAPIYSAQELPTISTPQ